MTSHLWSASGFHKHFVRETRFLIASHILDILKGSCVVELPHQGIWGRPCPQTNSFTSEKDHWLHVSVYTETFHLKPRKFKWKQWQRWRSCALVKYSCVRHQTKFRKLPTCSQFTFANWDSKNFQNSGRTFVTGELTTQLFPCQITWSHFSLSLSSWWSLSKKIHGALSLCRAVLPHSVASGQDKTNRAVAGQRKVQLKGRWSSKNKKIKKYIYT